MRKRSRDASFGLKSKEIKEYSPKRSKIPKESTDISSLISISESKGTISKDEGTGYLQNILWCFILVFKGFSSCISMPQQRKRSKKSKYLSSFTLVLNRCKYSSTLTSEPNDTNDTGIINVNITCTICCVNTWSTIIR